MLLNLFVFLSGVFCLIAALLLIINYRSNKHRNGYLIGLFFGAFLHRVYYVLFTMGILDFKLEYNLNLAYFLIPLYFLMFRKHHNETINGKLILILFLFSAFPLIMKGVGVIEPLGNFIYFAIYTSTLILVSLITAISSLKKSNYNYKTLHFKFSSLLLIHIFFIYLGTNLLMLYSLDQVLFIFDQFYKLSSISWLILLGFMLFNPELLFGKKKLENILVENYWEGVTIWSLKPLKKIQPIDSKLSQNLNDISKIILKINKVVKDESNFTHTFSLNKVVEIIRIPKSHFDYLFKYHCHLSKQEFKNYHQIIFVINKIKNGFLKTKTMESLIQSSGFKSKMTFYRSFRKFTNTTPLEFAKKYSESI